MVVVFWWFIDDLKEQKTQYDRLWEKIVGISGSSGLMKDSAEIRLNSDDLPLRHEFKINTVTIVVTMVVEKDNKFYPQISLNYCSYDQL